jgi:hypothetical protein
VLEVGTVGHGSIAATVLGEPHRRPIEDIEARPGDQLRSVRCERTREVAVGWLLDRFLGAARS